MDCQGHCSTTSFAQNEQLEHLSTVLNSVADGVFTVDMEMRISSFNRAAEEITGYSAEMVRGLYCYDVFRTDICSTLCPLREALKTGNPVTNREIDILSKDGRKMPISISASVLYDSAGNPVGGVETFRDMSEIAALRKELEERYSFHDIVSRNPAMRDLFDVLPDIAVSDATVLIHGESGTGKELFARAIHDLSPRKDGPLVVVNCGALPEPLLEAEIFGSRKGAYTGSVESRQGRLEAAQGGTLFLDEIGDLPLSLQVKLLRVLENREYQPLGSSKPQKADVRFVTATHRNIADMVDQGSFRRDLYFRINVLPISIPPLIARREDIPLLIDMALGRFNSLYGKKIRGFSSDAMKLLVSHTYPGNVRELINLVEQTVILCRNGEIGTEHLPEHFTQAANVPGAVLRQKGRPSPEELLSVLKRFGGNRNQVANEFGVDRTTLWRWMKKLELTEPVV